MISHLADRQTYWNTWTEPVCQELGEYIYNCEEILPRLPELLQLISQLYPTFWMEIQSRTPVRFVFLFIDYINLKRLVGYKASCT